MIQRSEANTFVLPLLLVVRSKILSIRKQQVIQSIRQQLRCQLVPATILALVRHKLDNTDDLLAMAKDITAENQLVQETLVVVQRGIPVQVRV